jgi:hypothetical protein
MFGPELDLAVDDRTSTPAKGRRSCRASRPEIDVEARRSGPPDSAAKRFARRRAGRCAGGSTPRGRRAQRREIGAAKSECAAIRAAWSGQPRNSVTRSRSRSRRVRPGSGVDSVKRVAPATSTESSPLLKPPVQKNGIGM